MLTNACLQRGHVGNRDSHLEFIERPLLSVCVPTFNRREDVCRLVRSVLDKNAEYEVCLHVDGSTDGTLEDVAQLKEEYGARLVVSSDANKGRAFAMSKAIEMASGAFSMIFDDDDTFFEEGISDWLRLPVLQCDSEICGLIFHMNTESGGRLGSDFPTIRTNFYSLRFDLGVEGDKKEVIRTDLLKNVASKFLHLGRRVPTSLLWLSLGLGRDVICVNKAVGIKRYKPGGLTDNIVGNLFANPRPMVWVNWMRLRGYTKRRYRSSRTAARSLLAMMLFSIVVVAKAVAEIVGSVGTRKVKSVM
jgi:glycosyltransferase involved in cell wall biosynthesis